MSLSTQHLKATQPRCLPTGKQDPAKPIPWWAMKQCWDKRVGVDKQMSKTVSSLNQFVTCGSLWLWDKSNSTSKLASSRSITSSWETCSILLQVCCKPDGMSKMASLLRIWWLLNAQVRLISYQSFTKVFAIAIKEVMIHVQIVTNFVDKNLQRWLWHSTAES